MQFHVKNTKSIIFYMNSGIIYILIIIVTVAFPASIEGIFLISCLCKQTYLFLSQIHQVTFQKKRNIGSEKLPI